MIPNSSSNNQTGLRMLSVHPLSLGELDLDQSFVTWQTGIGSKIGAPATAWLIKGTESPILVDTSFRSVEDAKRLTCRKSPEQSLEHQLSLHGLRPGDAKHVIHTHLHMDQAGQNYLIPNAHFCVQRRELQNAAGPDMYPIPFYDRLNIGRLIDELWPRVEVLDGDTELFPGIRCVVMPGHTPGH